MWVECKIDTLNDRIGIGTTTPAESLETTGTIKATGYKLNRADIKKIIDDEEKDSDENSTDDEKDFDWEN